LYFSSKEKLNRFCRSFCVKTLKIFTQDRLSCALVERRVDCSLSGTNSNSGLRVKSGLQIYGCRNR